MDVIKEIWLEIRLNISLWRLNTILLLLNLFQFPYVQNFYTVLYGETREYD